MKFKNNGLVERCMNLRDQGLMVKIAITLIVIGISYVLVSHIVTPLFFHEPGEIAYDFFPHEPSSAGLSVTIVGVVFSLAIGLLVAHYLNITKNFCRIIDKQEINKQDKTDADLEILKKMMNNDEKKLIEEIERSEEITQDSLRLRLDWSKAKTSTVLSILDRQGIIQKERSGKTYRIRLDPSIKNKKTV